MEKFGLDKVSNSVSNRLKKNLKKTLATGMAGLVFSAGGDWSQGKNFDKRNNDSGKKETTIKIENEETALKKSWGEKYEQARESFRDIQVETKERIDNGMNEEMIENRKEGVKRSEKRSEDKGEYILEEDGVAEIKAKEIKETLRKHIGGNDYLGKLIKEFDGKKDLALKEQEKRLEFLNKVEIIFMSGRDLFLKIRENAIRNERIKLPPDWLCKRLGEIEGLYQFFFPSEKGKIYLADKVNYNTYLHEFQHAAARGEWGINEKVEDILTKSFVPLGKPDVDEYLIIPGERLTRKQLADFELEKLGIKKYGEKFTKEHIPKIIECYEKGLFSKDVKIFFKTTDISYWRLIFNGIAQNEREKDSDKKTFA